MRITEREISALLIGAAIGSIVTYYNEKRIISNVRRDIDLLGSHHELTTAQFRKAIYPTTMVSDERILELYRWAQQLRKSGPVKLNPTRLAAEVIICEELLGLTRYDAIQALNNATYLHDLRTLRSKNSS
jgi:hypothetical protein